jgi:hypothetical protein
MSEENTSEEINLIEDNTYLTNAEETAQEAGIKVSRPKEIPQVDDENVIGSPGVNREGGKKRSALSPNESGILSSVKVDRMEQEKKNTSKPEKEITSAVFSTKNVTWEGVGKVYRGYNIVSEEDAKKWLTRGHIRLATPEEIKEEFGK